MQAPVSVTELRAARDEIADLIRSKDCNPILIRLGWHDAGTYDKVGSGTGKRDEQRDRRGGGVEPPLAACRMKVRVGGGCWCWWISCSQGNMAE